MRLYQVWIMFNDGRGAMLHIFEGKDDANAYCDRINRDYNLCSLFNIDRLSVYPLFTVPKGRNDESL